MCVGLMTQVQQVSGKLCAYSFIMALAKFILATQSGFPYHSAPVIAVQFKEPVDIVANIIAVIWVMFDVCDDALGLWSEL